MSRLSEAIRRSQRVESAPMGFGAARPALKPSMLVGFAGKASEAEAARTAGADLVVIDQELSADQAKELRANLGDLPFGVSFGVSGADQARELQAAGLDLLIIDAESTAASVLLSEELGYVLVLPDDPEELFLRSLGPLSLEAVLLKGIPSPFTVARQLEVGRVATLARKPLLCLVGNDPAKGDLECLRAAGVVGLLASSAEAVSRLKEAVAALPPRRQKRDERPAVSLPRGQAAQAEDDDDDDQ